jgi:mono/diheme cytochrome c family protein
MTRTRWTLNGALVALALGGAALVASCGRTAGVKEGAGSADTTQPMTAEARIELGRHLVAITGCNDCHTPGTLYGAPDLSRTLAGSELGWTGPWGTTYPSNLTPDPETGLGAWNEEQIVTAIRTGKRPDGSPILPPMPWPGFAQFTDEEAYAVAAYLKSLPPVRHAKVPTLPPGTKPATAGLTFPPPPAWDAPKAPSPEAQSGS